MTVYGRFAANEMQTVFAAAGRQLLHKMAVGSIDRGDTKQAAPPSSLAFMFWGEGVFVFPLLLVYTAISYGVFRGKVRTKRKSLLRFKSTGAQIERAGGRDRSPPTS